MTAADARRTAKATVHSPYGHGIDRPERVIDTIDAMYRRRQIDAPQKRAAETYWRPARATPSNRLPRSWRTSPSSASATWITTGDGLRDALSELAELWHPVRLTTKIRSAHANGYIVRFRDGA
jgi:hypothetical protein